MHIFHVRYVGGLWVGDLEGIDRAAGRTLEDLHLRATMTIGSPEDVLQFVLLPGRTSLTRAVGADLVAHTPDGSDREYALTRLLGDEQILQLHRIAYDSFGNLGPAITSIDLPIDVAVWLVPAIDRGAYSLALRAGIQAIGGLARGKGHEFGRLANAWPPPAWREQLRWSGGKGA